MQHIEEGRIHAWLDGELPAEEAAELEAHAAGCEECAAAVAEARGLIAASSRIVSALDAVPGNVLPFVAPRKRAWYAKTQLRAAAAVVVVAGASLLVMRGRDGGPVQELSRASAPASVPLQTETTTDMAQPAAPPVEEPARRAQAPLRKPQSRTTSPKVSVTGAAANASAPLPVAQPMAVAAKSAATSADRASAQERASAAPQALVGSGSGVDRALRAQRQRDSIRIGSVDRLDNVVVTGVASAEPTTPAELRLLHVDTTGADTRSTYSVSPGVVITLIEKSQDLDKVSRESKQFAPTVVDTAQSAPPLAPVRPINSITWVQKATGKRATLSGPFSTAELEALKRRLPMEKR
jgi:anti-sigma factor RsiW